MIENWFALWSWYRSARVKHLPCRRSQHGRARSRLPAGPPAPTSTRPSARRTRRSGRGPARSAAALRVPARRRGAAGARRATRSSRSPAPRPACPRDACAASSSAPPASSRPSPPSSTPAITSRRSSTRPDPDAKPMPRPDLRRMLVPMGPWRSSPPATSRSPSPSRAATPRSALAAGCPVVVKAHPDHPGPAAVLARSLARRPRAGCPTGPSRCSCTASRPASSWSSTRRSPPPASPARSPAAGRCSTVAAARPRPIPFYGELGSLTPSSSPRPRRRARRADRRRAWPPRRVLGTGSSAPSPGWSSCPRASRATPRQPTSARASPPASRRCCSTSACAMR